MLSLNRKYIQVERNGRLSYGGSQMWSDNPTVKICGCGPVAVLDTLLYLTHRQESPMSLAEYNRMLEEMSKRYFPLVRPFGINGLLLAAGMNRLLRRYRLPYRAFWAISGRKFWSRVEELLLSGRNTVFPFIEKQQKASIFPPAPPNPTISPPRVSIRSGSGSPPGEQSITSIERNMTNTSASTAPPLSAIS